MAAKPLVSFDNLKELADACISFYGENKEKMSLDRVRERRAQLSAFAEAFHNDCGTMSPSIERRIEDLKSGTGLILMTAHQPNLFAYSGVFRKATLNFVLAQRLEELLKVPVVGFFGVADQDFTDDRWVRSCQLPAVQRSGGIFSLDVKLPGKLMLNKVAGPSQDMLNGWKADVEKWLRESISSVERLCRALRIEERCYVPSAALHQNLLSLWSIVECCGERSKKYSDFNAFMMSKIVNDVWGYDTVFARFSQCQQAFVEEFNFLLLHAGDYSRLLIEAKNLAQQDVDSGVSDQEPWLVPFWYHCDCGSKAKLFANEENGCLSGKGNCLACGEQYDLEFGAKSAPDMSGIASRISARAIAVPLVFFNGVMPSCYVGGVGGTGYLMQAEHVARGLEIPFPPVVVWRPLDKYLGVGQMEALLELRSVCDKLGAQSLDDAHAILNGRLGEIHSLLDSYDVKKKRLDERLKLNPDDYELKEELREISISKTKAQRTSGLSTVAHELKIMENIANTLHLMPSLLDYAINIGLKETSIQWLKHLSENGSLLSDVQLHSLFSPDSAFDIS
jgi:hypothetical protein